MKLTVLLSIIAFSYGDKLDKTYLPPNAQASGGSEVILQTPISQPIIVLDEDFQRQVAEEETQRSVVTNLFQNDVQGPIVTNVATDSAALQRPIVNVVNTKSQEINDNVVRIGNRANVFVQNQNPVEYKEVNYPGPRYQVIETRTERTQASLERNAAVLRQEYKSEGDAYAYAYETENGIWAEENGVATNGVNANGAFSYIGDDGVKYSMSYTADENGFNPQGDHLPTPHPIPEEILRSLEQNARDEAAGIFDDGSYDERKYGGEDGRYQQVQQISVTTSRPQVTIFENRPTVPSIITQVASNKDGVIITNPSSKFVPGYRYPVNLENQKSYLAPVVNTLIQDVTPSTVNKYLPPYKRKANEDRPLKINGKLVPIRSRKPEYKKKENKENKS